MPARLVALRDHGVDPRGGDGPPLRRVGGRGEQDDPGRVKGGDPIGGGKAEVEAHDRGPFFQEHGEHRVVLDEASVDLPELARRLGPETGKDGGQTGEPGGLAVGVGHGGLVTEHVDVQRPIGQRLGLRGSYRGRTRHRRRRHRSSPARRRSATAAAMAGVETPAIGAWMMGRSMPSFSSSEFNRIALGVCVRVPGDCGSGSL